jgi:hypothetical protein
MRRVAAFLVLPVLLLPAWDCIRPARDNTRLWSRLQQRQRDAGDIVWDRIYAQLAWHLPATGRVGLLQVSPTGSPAQQREYYFLQYALAPRLVMPGADEDFLIVHGPAAAGAALVDGSKFALARRFDDDVALYRRTGR